MPERRGSANPTYPFFKSHKSYSKESCVSHLKGKSPINQKKIKTKTLFFDNFPPYLSINNHYQYKTNITMEKGDLTYRINGCAMTVHTKLGRGCMEYVYCRALAIELRRAGIAFRREVWLPIYYDNYKIAARRVDFLCENQVTVEVKAKTELENKDFSQALNTLAQINIKEGLLLNFGSQVLLYKHLFNNAYEPEKVSTDITPELVGEPSDDLFELRN